MYILNFFAIENFFADVEIRDFLREKGYSRIATLGCDDLFKRDGVL